MRATQTNSNPDLTDSPRILLMEDEAIVARGYQMALMEEGYGVDWATTGQAALDAIDRNGCDLLVADLRLPDMDGMEVIERIRQTRPEIGVIVVTGYAEVASAVQALKAGVRDYLSKPLTEQEITSAVAQALAQKNRDLPILDRTQSVQAAKQNVIRKNEVDRALEVSLLDHLLLPTPGFSAWPMPDNRCKPPANTIATPVSTADAVDGPTARHLPLEKNLIENAVEGIMAWDSTGTVTVFNKRMQAMLGYTQEETIGRMPFDRFFPLGAAEHFKRDMYAGKSGLTHTLLLPEADMLDKDGKLVPVQLSATVLFENSRESGIVVFARDLKDFREIEQAISDLPKLLHQNKMVSLGRLAASVVHEINNPLSGILNYVRMMLKSLRRSAIPSPQEVEKFQRYLTLVEGEVGRCAAIVSNLLAFSRKSKMEYGAVNLPDLLQKCVLLSQHKLDMEHIRAEIQVDALVPEVLGDFNQIQQCVINLIFNAIDAMDKGGTLWLGCRHHASEDVVELYVRDNGCGIAKENLFNIFDPFFTTKEEGRGLGLGLSTVYKIIAQHKGTINVESQLGRGTVFTIRLPALKTAEGPMTHQRPPVA
jgi:two-component system, NtrC family, sensor kinase